jgi:hypothetical protein
MTQIYLADDDSEPFTYLMESVSLNGCPLTSTDVTAEQYLQFAAQDLEEASRRGAVNALGNTKRALHQTVDSLLQSYGLLARNQRLSFPRKLELIDAAGLFSLSILNTLNDERNAVEHDYRVPAHARASEAMDVVRLWLLATRRLSEFVVYESLAGWRADQTLGVVQLNAALGLLQFFRVEGPSRIDQVEGKTCNFLLPIRIRGGGLAEGIIVEPTPRWSVALGYKNRENWRSLMRPIVALNSYRYGPDSPIVTQAGVQVSMRITVAPAGQEEILERIGSIQAGSPTLNYGAFAFGFSVDGDRDGPDAGS